MSFFKGCDIFAKSLRGLKILTENSRGLKISPFKKGGAKNRTRCAKVEWGAKIIGKKTGRGAKNHGGPAFYKTVIGSNEHNLAKYKQNRRKLLSKNFRFEPRVVASQVAKSRV